MKKLVAVLAMLTLAGVFAQAQDKGTEFKFGGDMMQRFDYDNNYNFASSNGLQQNYWLQRDNFHINAIASDKLQAYVDMLNYFVWGSGNGVPANASPWAGANGTPGTTGATGVTGTATQNMMQLYEAWLWWKVSDQFSLRSGRQAIEYGDGLVFSKNDWNANPYNTDGLMGRFSWDFMDLDVGGGVVSDLGVIGAPANTTDAETVFYGLYGSFKNLPDFLKKAEVFVVQLNADGVPGGGAGGAAPFAPSMNTSASWNLTTYGIHAKGDASMIDYRLDAAWQSGKNALTGGNVNFGGSMYDLEVGANFAEFMKARVYVGYHMDSGNDNTDATKNDHYQPLFFDQHDYAGHMGVFGFGNLTNIRIGATLNPMEDTSVGVEADLLSRTKTSDAATLMCAAPYNAVAAYSGCTFGNGLANTANQDGDSALGTEIDVWATHDYGHGFSMLAQAGFLSLGNYFKNAPGASVGSAYQLLAQAKYNF